MRTYLPQFAKEMHHIGKYAHEHKGDLYAAIDAINDTPGEANLTDEEKQTARKAIEDVIAAHAVFSKIWRRHIKGV